MIWALKDGKKIFVVKKIYYGMPFRGWGYLIPKEDLIKKVMYGDN